MQRRSGYGEREHQRCDLHLAEPEAKWLDQPREQHDHRDEEHGDLCRRGQRDLGRKRDLPAMRDEDGASVLGGVPDDRDDHCGDEEVAHPDSLGEDLERADEDLGNQRRRDGCDAEHEE